MNRRIFLTARRPIHTIGIEMMIERNKRNRACTALSEVLSLVLVANLLGLFSCAQCAGLSAFHCVGTKQVASTHCEHGDALNTARNGEMKSSCVGCECQADAFVATPGFEVAKPLVVSSAIQPAEPDPHRHLTPLNIRTIPTFGASISPGLLSATVVLRI